MSPDIRIQRTKVDVKIKLWSPDLANIFQQPDVIAGMETEELQQIIEVAEHELSLRGGRDVNFVAGKE